MIAFFVALLLAFLGHGPMPVAGAGTVPGVQVPIARPVHGGQGPRAGSVPGVAGPEVSAPANVPVTHAPTVAPPAAVAEQLPEEVIGRQIDCPDGSVGTEDAAGNVHCPS